jgi:hypothetical protein
MYYRFGKGLLILGMTCYALFVAVSLWNMIANPRVTAIIGNGVLIAIGGILTGACLPF